MDSRTFWSLEMASANTLLYQTLQNLHISFDNTWYSQPWRPALSWSLGCSGFDRSYREWTHLWGLIALHCQSYGHIRPGSMLTSSLRCSWLCLSLLWTDSSAVLRGCLIPKYCCTETRFGDRCRSSTEYLLSSALRPFLIFYPWTSGTAAICQKQSSPHCRRIGLLFARRTKTWLGWCLNLCILDDLLLNHSKKHIGDSPSRCSCIDQGSCKIVAIALKFLWLIDCRASQVSHGAEIWHP